MNIFPYQGYKKYTKQDIKRLLEENANTNTLTDVEKLLIQEYVVNPPSGGGSSGVSSFNARTGVVTSQSGDYTKADVGLSNVDNTSDLNKPISVATQTALNGKVNTSATEIKTLYESNANTNAYTDAEKTKLAGLTQGGVIDSKLDRLTDKATSTDVDNSVPNKYVDAELLKAREVSYVADLSYTASPTNGTVNSDTGTDATIPTADGTNAGLMPPAQFTKLAGIATAATANATNAELRARESHTGTQVASTISDFSAAADARITASNKVSSNTTPIAGSTQITNIIASTQAQYDAITPDASTLYIITEV